MTDMTDMTEQEQDWLAAFMPTSQRHGSVTLWSSRGTYVAMQTEQWSARVGDLVEWQQGRQRMNARVAGFHITYDGDVELQVECPNGGTFWLPIEMVRGVL